MILDFGVQFIWILHSKHIYLYLKGKLIKIYLGLLDEGGLGNEVSLVREGFHWVGCPPRDVMRFPGEWLQKIQNGCLSIDLNIAAAFCGNIKPRHGCLLWRIISERNVPHMRPLIKNNFSTLKRFCWNVNSPKMDVLFLWRRDSKDWSICSWSIKPPNWMPFIQKRFAPLQKLFFPNA